MIRLLSVLPFLAACDPAVTRHYQGEPIGRLSGTITSDLVEPPASEVVLGWLSWKGIPGTVVGARTPAAESFPSAFGMTLFHPPPDDGLNALPEDEPPVGFAWIFVLRSGATPPDQNVIAQADIRSLRPSSVLGWAEDHILAYVDRDVPSGSWAEQIFSEPVSRGFHLMRANGVGGEALEALRACRAAGSPTDECTPAIDPLVLEDPSTEISIRLSPDLSRLRLPVFALPDAVEWAFAP